MKNKLTKQDQAEREERLIKYRGLGYTDAQIAAMEGYSSAKAANQAICHALAKLPPEPAPQRVRAETEISNTYLRQTLQRVIDSPPPALTAIGRLIPDPDTCSCGNRLAMTMDGHARDCKVEPVRDMGRVVAAARELRMLGDQRLTMHAASKKQPVTEIEAIREMRLWFASAGIMTDITGRVVETVDAEIVRELPQVPADTDGAAG